MATTTDPITEFYAKKGRYPANNQQWWMARSEIDDPDNGIAVGDFLPDLLDKLFLGNMHSPKGHYILEAFNKDRSTISGVSSLDVQTIDERPSAVAFFSGRAWFGCLSTVYFSQILVSKTNASKCYMEADPTSEYLSDPVATDGGVIEIPEANQIIRLVPHAGGVLVFARNGVWYITGTQSGFSALDISVNKVSPIGTHSPMSVVETDVAVFWWSDVGIMGVSEQNGAFGPISGKFDKTNISETTVQSFYNDITDDIRAQCKGVYDPQSNIIHWMFRDDDVISQQYNKVLCLDLTLNAFFPWKFSGTSPVLKGIYQSSRLNTYTIPTDIKPSSVEYILEDGTNLRIGQVRSGEFVDWYTKDSVGVTYDSYMEAGYELFEDAMRNKNITYLFSYLTRTELTATDGVADYPSSCKMQIKWNWASSEGSNKWTSEVEVYRPTQLLLDNPDTGFGMVVTKNKVRGNGKAIQFRFGSSEAGKNFDLNGWAIEVSGNVTP